MKRLAIGLLGVWLTALSLSATPAAKPRPRPRPGSPPLDFSGVWEIDPATSLNVPSQMNNAVLSVTQKQNRIWISPVDREGKGSLIAAEEIVADGRPYEKALGPAGKGIVTADWAKDGQSLWIEIKAGTQDDPKKAATQRSVWKLSSDRKVWVRESVSFSQGLPRTARLVFRRGTRTPTPAPSPPPAGETKSRPDEASGSRSPSVTPVPATPKSLR
jgi:hypothetical protein